MGVEVVLGLDMPPAHRGAGDRVLGLDFRDVARSLRTVRGFAATRPLRAIIPTDDQSVVPAAHIAGALDLPHNSAGAAEASRDKHRMRQMLAQAGAPSPWFGLFSVSDKSAEAATRVPYPCVIKPTCLSGSRGVIRANNPAEFAAAFERVRAILASANQRDILVESYIPGREYALEGILSQGKLKLLAIFDKPDPLEGPLFEETLYVTPSRASAAEQAALAAGTAQAAAALGLREGAVHAELRLNEAGAWLIEIAGRSIGGLCSQTLRFAHSADVTLEELILRQALGGEIDSLERERRAGGVMMLPIPAAGTLMGVGGLEQAGVVPGIESVEITARVNYPVVPLPEGESYLGFIFARGDSPEQVEAALRAAHAALTFDIEPELLALNRAG